MFDVLKKEFRANTVKMQQIRAEHEKKVKEMLGALCCGAKVEYVIL